MELSIAMIQEACDEKAVQCEEMTTEEGRCCKEYNWKSNSTKRLGLDVNLAWIWKTEIAQHFLDAGIAGKTSSTNSASLPTHS